MRFWCFLSFGFITFHLKNLCLRNYCFNIFVKFFRFNWVIIVDILITCLDRIFQIFAAAWILFLNIFFWIFLFLAFYLIFANIFRLMRLIFIGFIYQRFFTLITFFSNKFLWFYHWFRILSVALNFNRMFLVISHFCILKFNFIFQLFNFLLKKKLLLAAFWNNFFFYIQFSLKLFNLIAEIIW
jgi:hypothetical protein